MTTISGMIAILFGPIEGKRLDRAMLNFSGVMFQLQQHSHGAKENQLLNSDPAYLFRAYLQSPVPGAHLLPQEKDFSKTMNSVRVSVDWVIRDFMNHFKFSDLKKNLKIGLSAVGKFNRVSALFTNVNACLYGNNVKDFVFNIDSPSLENYFQ